MDSERSVQYRVGDVSLAVVSDGVFYQDVGVIMGVVPRAVWEPVIGPPTFANHVALSLNCLLVRSMGRTILIDTGIGAKLDERQRTRYYPGDYGHLLRRLRDLGVGPEEIDAVVNSHLHFDHTGWNTVALHGRPLPTFPRAKYYVQRGELEDATHPNQRTRASYLPGNIVPLVENGQIEPVDGEASVTLEVRIVPTPGHTPHHASVVITSGGETAIYIGDLVQHGSQIARAAWISAFDVLPLVAMETKQTLLERAIRDRALLVSPHAEFPGAGRIVDDAGRPRFEPDAGTTAHAVFD
jgi:glyoxylase-like metal-dependent hydrolase (beta-lactamase superfamily II)